LKPYLALSFFLIACSFQQRENSIVLTNDLQKSDSIVLVADPVQPRYSQQSLKSIIDSLGIKPDHFRIEIKKLSYELSVWKDSVLLKRYPVVFGGNPVDDKLKRGDQCTPEGVFKIKSKYAHAKWSRFIWIDYPNDESWKKHNAAKKNRLISSKADIGGEIGIHGIPEGYDDSVNARQNWTLGCISMRNSDVIELYPYLGPDTSIEITK
jgi:murein L,D-transpeptidase YafK